MAAASAASLALLATGAASPRLTIGVVDDDPLTLAGTLSSGDGGESVVVEGSECAGFGYRVMGGAVTRAGGSWTWVGGGVSIRTTFRARWRDAVSENTVTVPRRITVAVSKVAGRRVFRVVTFGRTQNMHGKPVELQRFVQNENRWVRLAKAKLRREVGEAFAAAFVVRRRGLLLRGFVPQSTASPCFVANASDPVRS